jgi:DNA-binding CsgD family transcriptional regulator
MLSARKTVPNYLANPGILSVKPQFACLSQKVRHLRPSMLRLHRFLVPLFPRTQLQETLRFIQRQCSPRERAYLMAAAAGGDSGDMSRRFGVTHATARQAVLRARARLNTWRTAERWGEEEVAYAAAD